MSVTSIVPKPAYVPGKLQTGKLWSLVLAIAVLVAIVSLPPQAGLPVAGQRMLRVFAFAIVVWVSEALDYAVSAIVISALMADLLAISPADPAKPQVLLGTVQGLALAVGGFSNTALILVAAALFLATAMTITGLDRRIALRILSLVGARSGRVVIGNILVTIVLSFLVPSATARAAAMVPIMLGIIAAFGVDRRSRFAALLMITTAQGIGVWNVGVKTAAAQNMVAIGYIQKILGQDK
jgi:sodium-dependent dicarboxylate transporter 2/3/5